MRRCLLVLLALAVLAPSAEAGTRCKLREIPEAYVADEPVHRTLTGALEVLRRPQDEEDRAGEELKFAGDSHKVSPSTLRLVARRGTGRVWVMGATVGLDRMHAKCRRRLPPAARRRELRWYRRQQARPLRLAFVYDAEGSGSGAGFLGNAADLYAGRMWAAFDTGTTEDPSSALFGIVPDGIASASVTVDGREVESPVSANAWVVDLPPDPEGGPDRLVWRAADGSAVRSFARPPRWQARY